MAPEYSRLWRRFPARQIVFGANPADLLGREDKGEDLTFAQNTSLSGQFAQQWTLRRTQQEAALAVVANSKLRRLVYNKSCNCADVKIGDTPLLFKTTNRESPPRRRGPTLILAIDETGVTVKFRPQTFKVARFCVGAEVEAKHAEDAELDPLRARARTLGPATRDKQGQPDAEDEMEVDGENGNCAPSTGALGGGPGSDPAAIPLPGLPSP